MLYGLPALFALFVWWFSTGAIMILNGLPRQSFPWSMGGASIVLVGALVVLRDSAADASATGAYTAFTAALLAWAWIEMGFYLGFVTGPRRHACPPGCHGWRHFRHAIAANLYHEIAILVLLALAVGLTWGAPNQTGLWTLLVLHWMHLSARLNVFLGVSNLNADFLPEHLAHMRSFFRHRPMNLLFPISVSVSTIVALLLAQRAAGDPADALHVTGYSLVATLMVLAILEHWFLVLPLRAALAWTGLWQWSLGERAEKAIAAARGVEALPARAPIGGGS